MADCGVLLGAKDALRGTASLNWSVDRALADWDGVTVAGTPPRVTRLELTGRSLTGTIPAALGNLTGLEILSLNRNALTGTVPATLGQLTNLQRIYLNRNSLEGAIPTTLENLERLTHLFLIRNSWTGCIAPPLHSVTNNDLARLGLPDCPPTVAISAVDATVTEGTAATFTVTRSGYTDTTVARPVTISVADSGSFLDGTAPTSVTIPVDATSATVTVATADDEHRRGQRHDHRHDRGRRRLRHRRQRQRGCRDRRGQRPAHGHDQRRRRRSVRARPPASPITRAGDTSGALAVALSVTDSGSFLDGTAPTSVTIAADATSATLSVATADDSTDEPNGTITVTLTDGAAYDLGAASSAVVTVEDNDLPTVTISAGAAVTEGTDASFTDHPRGRYQRRPWPWR